MTGSGTDRNGGSSSLTGFSGAAARVVTSGSRVRGLGSRVLGFAAGVRLPFLFVAFFVVLFLPAMTYLPAVV